MSNLWCKLWNFFLNIFTQAVHAIAYAIKTIGEVAIGLAGDLLHAVGSALGIGGLLPILLIGGGLWFLLGRKKDDEPPIRTVVDEGAKVSTGGAV